MITLLSQSFLMTSTSTFLGLAIISILSQAPADAALFKIYGKLAPQATYTQNDPIVDTENGFFEGTIDIDDTNPTNGFQVKAALVRVFTSQGTNTFSFRNEYPNPQFETGSISLSNLGDRSSISFDYAFNDGRFPTSGIGTNSLYLFIDKPNFVGKITSESSFSEFRKPYYVPRQFAPAYTINVVDGYVTPVPEPLTIVGTAVAGAIGWSMKRRQKALSRV